MKTPHEKAMQAIRYGQSCAMRLKLRLDDPTVEDGTVSSYDLAKSIADCFSKAISNFSDEPKYDDDDDKVSSLSSRDSSLYPLTSHSKKRKINSTSSCENWRDDSPDPLYYDGYLWRKYGQKNIKNSIHQRSYYRCSYNKDHDCGATKHEQKIKDNPPVYRTTYFGHHTCKFSHNQDAIFTNVLEQVDDLKSTRMIRFGEDLDQDKENHSNGFSISVKKEENVVKKEAMDQKTGFDQHVIEENLSSSSLGSHPCEYSSELLWDNLDLWDHDDKCDFAML